MNKMTKTMAREIIEINKDQTGYFDGSITEGQMYSLLRYRMGFGIAECNVIIAALVAAGAVFPC